MGQLFCDRRGGGGVLSCDECVGDFDVLLPGVSCGVRAAPAPDFLLDGERERAE